MHLRDNFCINEDFLDPTRITAMPQIVTKKCGFDETIEKLLEKVLEGQKTNIKEMKRTQNRCDSQFAMLKDSGDRLKNLMAEMTTKNEEINANHCKIKNIEERVKTLEGKK